MSAGCGFSKYPFLHIANLPIIIGIRILETRCIVLHDLCKPISYIEDFMSKYRIELELIRDMLGTNPSDPDIQDTHIIEKERRIILEKSKINKEINKYGVDDNVVLRRMECKVDFLTSELATFDLQRYRE